MTKWAEGTPLRVRQMRADFDAREINGDRRIIDLWTEVDRLNAVIATLTARLAEAEAALAALREEHPEPEGVVEEPPRDNSITDAW